MRNKYNWHLMAAGVIGFIIISIIPGQQIVPALICGLVFGAGLGPLIIK